MIGFTYVFSCLELESLSLQAQISFVAEAFIAIKELVLNNSIIWISIYFNGIVELLCPSKQINFSVTSFHFLCNASLRIIIRLTNEVKKLSLNEQTKLIIITEAKCLIRNYFFSFYVLEFLTWSNLEFTSETITYFRYFSKTSARRNVIFMQDRITLCPGTHINACSRIWTHNSSVVS